MGNGFPVSQGTNHRGENRCAAVSGLLLGEGTSALGAASGGTGRATPFAVAVAQTSNGLRAEGDLGDLFRSPLGWTAIAGKPRLTEPRYAGIRSGWCLGTGKTIESLYEIDTQVSFHSVGANVILKPTFF